MKRVTSLKQIITMARGRALYIRWSRGPALDRKMRHSVDQVSGARHSGISVQRVRADDPELLARMIQEYQFLRRKDAKIYCWILTGEINGTDSDGAPTVNVDTMQAVGCVDDALIAVCSEYNTAYWAWKRRGYKADERSRVEELFCRC